MLYTEQTQRIISELNLPVGIRKDNPVSNTVETESCTINGVEIKAEVVDFGKTCRVDIDICLPEGGVLADTFMDRCAEIEKLPKNHHGEYCHGPRYRDFRAELGRNKMTCALSPWSNTMFYVRSEGYKPEEVEEAVDNAVALAKKFISHLDELKNLRYWTREDKEVITKAREIVANADFHETDDDEEYRSHWLEDRNSFVKGWFFPFNNRGRGTFDTLWPSSVDYAAKGMGRPGSFEYAVSCIVLEDEDYIRKARKACVIREVTRTYQY